MRKERNKRYQKSLKTQKKGANFEDKVQTALGMGKLTCLEVLEVDCKSEGETKVIGFEQDLPDRFKLPSMFPKEDLEQEGMDYYEYLKCQQVVPERRLGKKCQRCWRKEKGLPVSMHLKHSPNCFGSDSDDDSNEDQQDDRPEPDAADDDPEDERNRLYTVTERYQSYTK